MLFIVAIARKGGLIRSKYLVVAETDGEAITKLKALADSERKDGEPIFFPEKEDTMWSEPVEFNHGIQQI